jgi:hypothetical protein
MGARAREAFLTQQGATKRVVEYLRGLLTGSGDRVPGTGLRGAGSESAPAAEAVAAQLLEARLKPNAASLGEKEK